jgi:hypothetical protein
MAIGQAPDPTGIGGNLVFVATSAGITELTFAFVQGLPDRADRDPPGFSGGIGVPAVQVAMVIGGTVPEPRLAT